MEGIFEMTGRCNLCDGNKYRISGVGVTAQASLCSCAQPCRSCGGSRFVVDTGIGAGLARRCDCVNLERRISLFNQANVPARFAGCWIEDIEETHETQKQAKYALLKHQESYSKGDCGFLLWGEPGLGKTHMLCGLMHYLTLEQGVACMYVDFMQLLYDLKKGWAEGRWESELVSPLLAVDVLVVDELGKGRDTDWELTVLDELISARYNARKTVHATSNFPPEEGRTERSRQGGIAFPTPDVGGLSTKNNLREKMGERIFSRLSEMCRFYHVEGEDFRKRVQNRFKAR